MHPYLVGVGILLTAGSCTLAGTEPAVQPTPAPGGDQHAPRRSVRVPILMYHQFRELDKDTERSVLRFSVSPKAFEEQMRWLKDHGYTTVPLDRVAAGLADPALHPPLPEKPVVVTIDDGWTSAYTHAFPILQKVELTATFFVFPNALSDEAGGMYMSWRQVQELADKGMCVGSHTLTHPHLPTLTPEAAKTEIVESKQRIEDRLRRPVNTFAYPYGEFDPGHVRQVQEAGYTVAVSTEPGVEQSAGDALVLRRTIITYFDSIDTFAAKVKGELIPGQTDAPPAPVATQPLPKTVSPPHPAATKPAPAAASPAPHPAP